VFVLHIGGHLVRHPWSAISDWAVVGLYDIGIKCWKFVGHSDIGLNYLAISDIRHSYFTPYLNFSSTFVYWFPIVRQVLWMKTGDLACHLGLKRKHFFHVCEKRKLKKWASIREILFRENFPKTKVFVSAKVFAKFLFSPKFLQKISVYAKVFTKFFVKTKIFAKLFVSGKVFCENWLFGLKHYPNSTIQLGTSTLKRLSHLLWNRTRIFSPN
jgi:hypothetical protein